MAEPAMDVGLFCSAIKDTGMNALDLASAAEETVRQPRLMLLDDICKGFLAEYQAHAPVSPVRVAIWEAVDYLRNTLHTWVKVKPVEPDHALYTLQRHLSDMLPAR
ncbi:MAG: hypothetical protein EHM70_18555 [Chloroflexota bacterium]|nr:MAG: hypothetical protein EHM70_18555 [Chloroflexota bacterium]